jgi:hypothetical protein
LPGNQILIAASTDHGTFSDFIQGLLMILDSSGNLIENKLIGDSIHGSLLIPQGISVGTSNFVITTKFEDSTEFRLKLMRFDFSLNLINERVIPFEGNSNILKKGDGSFVIYDISNSGLLCVDSNFSNGVINVSVDFIPYCSGNQSLYSLYDLAYIGVGGFGSGEACITYYNNNCRAAWCKTFSSSSIKIFDDIKKGTDGTWYLLGHGYNKIGIFHLDQNLSVINSRIADLYLHYEDALFARQTLTPQNKIVFTGAGVKYGGMPNGIFNVIVVDSSLYFDCSSVDTVTENLHTGSSLVTFNTYDYPGNSIITNTTIPYSDKYPGIIDCSDTIMTSIESRLEVQNPFSIINNSSTLEIKSDIIFQFSQLRSISGEIIFQKNSNSNYEAIDINGISTGIYLLTITCKNKLYHFKVFIN